MSNTETALTEEQKALLANELRQVAYQNPLNKKHTITVMEAAKHIEELEKQVAELELQVKVSPVRAVIEMYDNDDFGAEEIYSFVQDFLRLQGEEFTEQWQLALDVIWGKWDENFYSETLDPDEYINQIRVVIGMEMPT